MAYYTGDCERYSPIGIYLSYIQLSIRKHTGIRGVPMITLFHCDLLFSET